MKTLFRSACAIAVMLSLAACGGGGSDGDAAATATDDSAAASATPAVVNAKLKVIMTPATLTVGSAGSLSFVLSNSAAVEKKVAFKLGFPDGSSTASSISFSSPCSTPAYRAGPESIGFEVVIPANTATCTFDMQKRFSAATDSVAFVLSDLSNVELDGDLPTVKVTP